MFTADNDYVKTVYNEGNITIIILDGEFNEEIWINAKDGMGCLQLLEKLYKVNHLDNFV